MRIIIASALVLLLSAPALAAFEGGPKAPDGGFKGPAVKAEVDTKFGRDSEVEVDRFEIVE